MTLWIFAFVWITVVAAYLIAKFYERRSRLNIENSKAIGMSFGSYINRFLPRWIKIILIITWLVVVLTVLAFTLRIEWR